MKTIKITTRQIFENFMASVEDVIWDSAGIAPIHVQSIGKVASQDINQLREMFIEGYTPMMMGIQMTDIENSAEGEEIEIRIYKDTLIGVIIDSEIKY